MKKLDFNKDWTYKRIDMEDVEHPVNLPHDAMITEPRAESNPGIHNIGYFEGHDYEYTKCFELAEDLKDKELTLEFEGVYHDAKVYINDKLVTERPYGYTNFYVPMNQFLNEGKNEVRVIAHNADQPNSRWYTGSGIYRPVWLFVADTNHIAINGIKARTVALENVNSDYTKGDATIELSVTTVGTGALRYEIIDAERVIAADTMESETTEITLKDVELWDSEHPYLYTLRLYFADDMEEISLGIRTLAWDRENGIQINGRRVILKGACIHSDNQLLGAITDPDAELRRVRILKENGYNAIRSAHNPCSKYLLEACDKLGMYMMDEYVDMWYIHKNKYDYANFMTEWYERDLYDMVEKNYNHPSVVLYSTGNEVAETGQAKGIELTKAMTDYLHSLDDSRPVTCGVNIFFNLLFAMGFGIYSDEKAEKEATQPNKKKKAVGSEFYNQLAGLLGDKSMKIGATLHGCDVKTRDAYANMDIAGYNYGILRYKKDLRRYPNRLILGSETFCKDAYKFYEFAKENPGVVGDFVWAGMDYLGEAGIGSWEYEDYAPKDADKAGWLSAGSGRIDLTGKPIGEAYYTRVAFEKEMGPIIAVTPVYQTGSHSPSAWKMSDAIRSWSYRGCEGYQANVEVYARAYSVELILNGNSLGRKKSKDCVFRFKTKYYSGDLVAVAYDKNGKEIGRDMLSTAEEDTVLGLYPEEATVHANGLSYIRIRLTDEFGNWKPKEKRKIKITVENGELLALGNGCPYNPAGYHNDTTGTYYGEALAIVRAADAGELKVMGHLNGAVTTSVIPIV